MGGSLCMDLLKIYLIFYWRSMKRVLTVQDGGGTLWQDPTKSKANTVCLVVVKPSLSHSQLYPPSWLLGALVITKKTQSDDSVQEWSLAHQRSLPEVAARVSSFPIAYSISPGLRSMTLDVSISSR